MIVLDGATGTELARKGVDTRTALFSAAALLTAEGRQKLLEVHREYVAAGAQVITANTFRTNPRKAGGRWRELTRTAVQIARDSGAPFVAGSMAPVEDCYVPELRPPLDVAREEHRRMAEALSGCDLLLVETIAAAGEGRAAVEAALETGLPVWAAVSLPPSGRLRTGEDVRAFFESLPPIAARLINCTPCDGIVEPFDGAYANMGEIDPATGWPASEALSPAAYAARAKAWLEKGAVIVGGCCGTTPAHIAALAKISPVRHDPCQPKRRLS